MIKSALNLVSFALILFSVNASADTKLDGFLSAQFGMSAEAVRNVFEKDGVVFSNSETADGDHLIYAERKQHWITSELLYVFPANSDRLALVIEIFPGLVDTDPVHKALLEKLGQPSSDNYPETVLKRMQASNLIPNGVNQLAIWNITKEGIDREARVMGLDKYVRVEYIDNDLMGGN